MNIIINLNMISHMRKIKLKEISLFDEFWAFIANEFIQKHFQDHLNETLLN